MATQPIESIAAILWQMEKLGEAMWLLAERQGLIQALPLEIPKPPSTLTPAQLEAWFQATSGVLQIEVESQRIFYPMLDETLGKIAPALIQVEGGFLALLRRRSNKFAVLTPDGTTHFLSTTIIHGLLCEKMESHFAPMVAQVLAQTRQAENPKLRQIIFAQQLKNVQMSGIWQLRLAPDAQFHKHLRREGVARNFGVFLVTHIVHQTLFLFSWGVLGNAILSQTLDTSVLLIWLGLILLMLGFRTVAGWMQGRITIGLGVVLKRRLLYGATQLPPDKIRHEGVGQLLGRVFESNGLELLALTNGFRALNAALDILVALPIFIWSVAGGQYLVALGIVLLVIFALAWRLYHYRLRWTIQRRQITHDLVEQMVGHRTRRVQQRPEDWHTEEDRFLEHYLNTSAQMDSANLNPGEAMARLWLLVGLLVLLGQLWRGLPTEQVALSLGAILAIYRALLEFSPSLWHLGGAIISWQQVRLFFERQSDPTPQGIPELVAAPSGGTDAPILQIKHLGHAYGKCSLLQDVNLQIQSGERILLEGASGSGKSTLVALLLGIRPVQQGAVLVDNFDYTSLGAEGWRLRIVSAPQFHENHVLTETFAFNLLLGRHFPPSPEDLAEAEEICHELGLGELLQKMPSGLFQMVGENGWQLSHGERSRLYIARALLQNSSIVILDESFAALDAQNVQLAMECAQKRAKTLLVIAHP